MNRIEREKRVVSRMIGLYCRAHHDASARDAASFCDGVSARDAASAPDDVSAPDDGGDRDAGGEGLCPACAALRAYALRRLDACRFGAAKPPCERCPIHCYAPACREQIRAVMRYAGPRMLLYAPLDALWHLLRRLKPETQELRRCRELRRSADGPRKPADAVKK